MTLKKSRDIILNIALFFNDSYFEFTRCCFSENVFVYNIRVTAKNMQVVFYAKEMPAVLCQIRLYVTN